jgi:hypothetical protein
MTDQRSTNAPISLIRVGFKAQDIASVRVRDTDLIIVLKNGQSVTLRDGAMRAMIDPELRIDMADGEIRASDLLKQVGSVKVDDLAQAVVTTTPSETAPAATKAGVVNSDVTENPAVTELLKHAEETNASLREFIDQQQARSETLEHDYQALSAKLAEISDAKASTSFISPAWGALGALGALGVGGGGGSSAAGAVTTVVTAPTSSLTLAGEVVLGPVVSGNTLRVVAYDRNGSILGSDESVEAGTGAYKITLNGGYTGVIVLKVISTGSAVDYMDEGTLTAKSLGSNDMRAIVLGAGTGTQTVNIDPLTELAAVEAGMTTGSVTYTGSAASALATSQAIAKLLALSTTNQLLSDLTPVATVNADGSSNAAANDVGRALATISLVGSQTGNTINQTVANITTEIAVSNGSASFVDPTVNSVNTLAKALLVVPPTVSKVALSNDSGISTTDLITNAANQTLTVTFSSKVSSEQTVAVSTDGTTWSSAVVGNGTDGIVFNNITLAAGTHTLQFHVTNTNTGVVSTLLPANGANLNYALDTVAPVMPVISNLTFSADTFGSGADYGTGSDLITKTQVQTISGTISSAVAGSNQLFGSIDGGTTFTQITLGTTNANTGLTNFSWTGASLIDQTAAGTKSLVFKLVDAAGNVSTNSTAINYVLDTLAPTETVSNVSISADTNGISGGAFVTGTMTQIITAKLSAALDITSSNGETLFGSLDGGVTWTNIDNKVLNRATGGTNIVWDNAQLVFSTNQVPNDAIVFKIVDAAGNESSLTGLQPYTLLPPPATPSLSLANDTGSSPHDNITKDGTFNVGGLVNGAQWQYSTDGGVTWTTGAGSSFVLGAGTYAAQSIKVHQILAGLTSSSDFNVSDISIVTSASTPVPVLAQDTGVSNSDGITDNPQINVSGLEVGTTWSYSTDGGITWNPGSGSTFNLTQTSTNPSGQLFPANSIEVRQTDLAGNVSLIGKLASPITLDTIAPTEVVQNVTFSAISGMLPNGTYSSSAGAVSIASNGLSFVTNQATQTITGTLSSQLTYGESLMAVVDGVKTDITNLLDASSKLHFSWTTTLNSTQTNSVGSIAFEIDDLAGNQSISSALSTYSYTIDTKAPTTTIVANSTSISSDTGLSNSDNITNQSAQTIRATLSDYLISSGNNNETLWGSTDSGNTWTNVTAYLNGTKNLAWQTLLNAGTNNIVFKISDIAGNIDPSLGSLNYTLDTHTPTVFSGTLAAASDAGLSSSDGITNITNGLVYSGVVDPKAFVDVLIGTNHYTATANSSGAYTITTTTALTDGTYTPKITETDVAGTTATFSGTSFTINTVAPTATISGSTYLGYYQNDAILGSTPTITLTGTGFTQLGAVGTDIKAQLNWNDIAYDYNGTGVKALNHVFTSTDIQSAKITDDGHLTIQLTETAAQQIEGSITSATNLSANTAVQAVFGNDSNGSISGNIADTIDVTTGFLKSASGAVDTATGASGQELVNYVAPTTSINLGQYGKLIDPVVVAVNTGTTSSPLWVNKTFYYWNLSGTGTANSADTVNHNYLDNLFYRNSSFTGGTAGADTTSAGYVNATTNPAGTNDFRYGDLTAFNNLKLALPTGAVTGDAINAFRAANAEGNQRSDLTAIWDQFNTGVTTGGNGPGTPTGWAANLYWSATSTGAGTHVGVGTNICYVPNGNDTTSYYAALQVL